MTDIRRQEAGDYRQAVKEISTGTAEGVRTGFDLMDRKGWIVEVNGPERHQMLVNDYLEAVNEKKTVKVGNAFKEVNKTA